MSGPAATQPAIVPESRHSIPLLSNDSLNSAIQQMVYQIRLRLCNLVRSLHPNLSLFVNRILRIVNAPKQSNRRQI